MNSGPRGCGLAIAAFLLLATPSFASYVTIRPDGTGDFPTINDAVQFMSHYYLADTIMVEPGYYDEVVNISDLFQVVIHGRAGAESTRVRKFVSEPEQPFFTSWSWAKAVGIQIDARVAWGRNSKLLSWEDCIFAGGYDMQAYGGGSPVQRCVFRAPSSFIGLGGDVTDCTFEKPVYLENVIGYIRMFRCAFREGDELVRVMPRDESTIIFEECTFSDAGNAVVIEPRRYWRQSVAIWRCRFERLSGAALSYEYADPNVPEEGSLDLTMDVSYLSNVGQAIRCASPIMVGLYMTKDTVRSVRGNAIEATVRGCRVSDLQLSNVGGSGMLLRNQNFTPDRYYYRPNDVVILDSRIRRCGGDGIAVEQLANPVWDYQQIAIRNTVVEDCGGTGVFVLGSQPSVSECLLRDNAGDGVRIHTKGDAPACSLSYNTAVGNGGDGLRIEPNGLLSPLVVTQNLVAHNSRDGIAMLATYTGVASFNDAWTNGGLPYVGLHSGEVNLQLDPYFCMRSAGVFSVRTDSPCAPSGPHGRIGSEAVGCVVQTAVEPSLPGRRDFRVTPNPARGPVSFDWGTGESLDGLAVFDTQGRLRWKAPAEALSAGSLRWNAHGQAGDRLPPGVYLVRWSRGRESFGSRLVLLDQ